VRSIALGAGLLLMGAAASFAQADMFNSGAPASTKMPSKSVASLPPCNGANAGLMYLVTDALAPVTRVTVVGGGAVIIPVVCAAGAWVVVG